MRYTFLNILFALIFFFPAAAKENKQLSHPLLFIENKGQVIDQDGHARNDIHFKTGSGNLNVFIGSGKISYQWAKTDAKKQRWEKFSRDFLQKPDSTPFVCHMYRLDMELEGANRYAQVIAEDKQAYHENYYTAAAHTNEAGACSYNKITYKNIYPNIDWVFYIKNNKVEYDFIVHPRGDVKKIKIKYNGASSLACNGRKVNVKTSYGSVSEGGLNCYEQNTGKQLAAMYRLKAGVVGFSVQTKRSNKSAVIIDPVVEWGTYFGGDGDDAPWEGTTDLEGNTYVCGHTTSTSNIATAGAYQSVFMGFYDAFLAKFSSNGHMDWATYYGGTDQDEAFGVAYDLEGSSFITGFTLSNSNIATLGAHQTAYKGGYDAFLAKFNGVGALQWSTYSGGAYYELGRAAACDPVGYIYISGETASPTDIASPGSFQDTFGATTSGNNAYLAKFNTNGGYIWGTYFGGNPVGYDSIGNTGMACTCDNNLNVYLAGGVYGNNIHTTPGCYQDTCWAGADGYFAKFDSACQLQWSTYFGGDSGEHVQQVTCDDSLNLYATGITFSANGIATPGAHQTIYGGGNSDVFLTKFSPSGSRVFSTYYGGSSVEEAFSIANYKHKIYLAGYSYSQNNIATPGSYQDTNRGITNAYLSIFSSTGALQSGTFYGGYQWTAAIGIGCDSAGHIYLSGGTSCTEDIATPGSYQDTYADSGDAFVVKFDTGTTGINNVNKYATDIIVSPNPNNGHFTVSGQVAKDGWVVLLVLNMEGEEIYQQKEMVKNGFLEAQLNLPICESGTYVLKICDDEAIITKKLIINL